LICCVDGLKGFPEAIENVFPQAKVQLCIVHMVRNSLKYVSYKDYKAVCSDLKGIYRSPTEEIALDRLNDFSKKWDSKYPTISKSWEAKWVHLSVFFQYPQEIRTVIYTTNAVESLHSSLRKISRNRKLFQNPESVLRLFYLAIVNASKKWSHPIRNWNQAIHRFMIESPEAFKQ
jgi:transposase-like protein